MATPKLTLYTNPAAVASFSLHLLLKYHNVTDIEIKNIDFQKNEQHTPEFLALNPYHTVPVLVDHTNDIIFTESAAIIQYIAEIYGWTGKYGFSKDNLTQRGRTMNYMAMHPYNTSAPNSKLFRTIYAAFFGSPDLFDAEDMKTVLEETKKLHFPVMEALLKKNGGWITGEPSIADVYALGQYYRYLDDSGNCIYNFCEFPEIVAWIERVKKDVYVEEIFETTKFFANMLGEKIGDKFCLAKHEKKEETVVETKE